MEITDFIEFSAYFSAFMHKQRAEGSRITYRFLVRELQLKSTSSLAMIATGRRLPNPAFLEKLCLKLRLNPKQIEYAQLMVLYAQAKDPSGRQYYWEKMNRLRPQVMQQQVDLGVLELISQWEYLILICMAGEAQGLSADLEKVAQQLKYRLKPTEIKAKLERLIELGFIAYGPGGTYVAQTGKVLATPGELSSTVIKKMHQQMLEVAAEELYQQEVAERFFASLFLTVNPRKIGRAKELFQKFIQEFDADMADEDPMAPTEVYNLGLQFYKMTACISQQQERSDD